jgi:hypothetical protein
MIELIRPVDKDILKKELKNDHFVRTTNYGHNELYIFNHKDCPGLIREVGRLRELSFRAAGGGTGKDCDLDEYDLSDDPYHQLIVWDPKFEEILGGYRFYIPHPGQSGDEIMHKLVTSHLFTFSDAFKKDYLPYTIELGRSFVQPAYQSTNPQRARKGIFALDNLWDGLGALLVDNPTMKYFFGKVTMYPHFNRDARNLILCFLDHYFGDRENLVNPINPLIPDCSIEKFGDEFHGKDFRADYKTLSKKVRSHHENLPPLINAYMNLSPTLKTFGTVITEDFGSVEETGILITIKDIYIEKVERHVSTYKRVMYYLKRDKIF